MRATVVGGGELGDLADPTSGDPPAGGGFASVDDSPERRLLLAENALAVLRQTQSHDRSLSKAELNLRNARVAELERLLCEAEGRSRSSDFAHERLQAAWKADQGEAERAAASERLQLRSRLGELRHALDAARDDLARQARQVQDADRAHQTAVKALRRDVASQAQAASAARAEVRRLQARITDLQDHPASTQARDDAPPTSPGGVADRPEGARSARPTSLEALAAERRRAQSAGREKQAAEPWNGAFPLPGQMTALSDLAMTTEALDVSVSVIIPTLDAGDEFVWLLRKLRAQKGFGALEIVIVDSGSTDRTLELAQMQGCTVVRIPKAEFSHSHARNLGADTATGELLLFMVQDAYPVGDYWLHGLARALLHPRSEAERVSAVSATEYPRSDSELLYNALADTHYSFLGCRDADRIGRMTGEDNHSIRAQGQLSDITCLIARKLFLQYRYHGRYAEDLLLGVQLIREGHKVAMVSSVRTIHSHNRPTGYYVKRVFVDVLFLTEVFPDFGVPPASSVVGTLGVGCVLQRLLQVWEPAASRDCASAFNTLIALVEDVATPAEIPEFEGGDGFGYARLAEWIDGYSGRTGLPLSSTDVHDGDQVRTMLVARLHDIKAYATGVYDVIDAEVAENLKAAALKMLAMTIGASLAFIYLNAAAAGGGDRRLALLRPMMLDGV